MLKDLQFLGFLE